MTDGVQGCLNSRDRIKKDIHAFKQRLIKQFASVTASQIMNQIELLEGYMHASVKKASGNASAWLDATAISLRDALRDELAGELGIISQGGRQSEPNHKRIAIIRAKDKIKEFWSEELLFRSEIETWDEIEALEAGKKRAKQKARQIASALAQPFHELCITISYEGSHRGYNDLFSPERGYREEYQTHDWIQCMADFKRLLYTAEKRFERSQDRKITLMEAIGKLPTGSGPITVALIDDGVDLLEACPDKSVSLTGRSFHPKPYPSDDYLPWYFSSGGHGTAMAKEIQRIFPRANLRILKLQDTGHPTSKKRRITMKSAAQVRSPRWSQKTSDIN